MDEHTRNQIIIEQIKLLANDIVDILYSERKTSGVNPRM
jgi:hypothetical protein